MPIIVTGSLINQLFLKFILHLINAGMLLASGAVVRQQLVDPGYLSSDLIGWFQADLLFLQYDTQIDSLSAPMLFTAFVLSCLINS
jgi:NADH:ubiquinone oxidoreductase subunit 5 (subunit L)/multisubunit Na+/H+ antiporter MnhA subunit